MYMTFPITNNKANNTQSQSGVSLMLAVLVLSAITAIAFSLATIVFIELQASGDSLRTEPALYATFGVTEEALFQYKRFVPADSPLNVLNCTVSSGGGFIPSPGDPNGICNLNNVQLGLPGEQPIEFDDSPRVEFIGANSTKILPMFKPAQDNPDPEPDTTGFEQIYSELQIDVLDNGSPSAPLDVYLVKTGMDGVTLCDDGGTYPDDCGFDEVYPGNSFVYSAFDDTDQFQYDLVLRNTNSRDLSASITTYRVDNQLPEGLPFIGEQVLRIMANYVGLTRTYQVRIPIP